MIGTAKELIIRSDAFASRDMQTTMRAAHHILNDIIGLGRLLSCALEIFEAPINYKYNNNQNDPFTYHNLSLLIKVIAFNHRNFWFLWQI